MRRDRRPVELPLDERSQCAALFAAEGVRVVSPGGLFGPRDDRARAWRCSRVHPGFTRIVHRYGDGYIGWPADFYLGHVRLLGTHVGKEGFRAFVATRVAKLDRGQAINCIAA
jgi:hypothetical protein